VVLFSEDADIIFVNLTANYEFELKVFEPVSLYAGGGAGAELITINDRFDEAVDEDVNFVAQVFAGIRVSLGSSIDASVGVRRIFREGLSLLGDQFSTEDAWGFEAGIGFRF
jgi:opacity protein-like surface antigen